MAEGFRHVLLARPRAADRLSEEAHEAFLAWAHSGFSAHAEHLVEPDETDPLEHLARYIARAPMRVDAVSALDAAGRGVSNR